MSALQWFDTHLDLMWGPVRAGLLQKALLLCSFFGSNISARPYHNNTFSLPESHFSPENRLGL